MPQQNLTNALVGFTFLAVLILIAVNYCSVSFACGRGGVHEGLDGGYRRFGNYPVGPEGEALPSQADIDEFRKLCQQYRLLCASIAAMKRLLAKAQSQLPRPHTPSADHGLQRVQNQIDNLVTQADQLYSQIQTYSSHHGTCNRCH